jgi:hypothetical protein
MAGKVETRFPSDIATNEKKVSLIDSSRNDKAKAREAGR